MTLSFDNVCNAPAVEQTGLPGGAAAASHGPPDRLPPRKRLTPL